MIGSPKRATRRVTALRRTRTSVAAGAAAAAMTLGLTSAPTASAAIPIDININPAYTAGAVASLLNFVGTMFPGTSVGGVYNSGPPQTVNFGLRGLPYSFEIGSIGKIDFILDINAILGLNNVRPTDTEYLYNTLASIPQQPNCGGSNGTACRYALMLGTSEATLNLANAYRAEIANVQDGVTRAGYIPFQSIAGSTPAKPTQTNQVLGFLQNQLRPNGGFLSRFPGLSRLLGQDPTMPAAGQYTSSDGTITLNTATLDATYAYDPNGDFPVAGNIFSILNSLDAFLPLNLAGGLSTTQPFVLANSAGKTAEIKDVGLNIFSLFQVPVSPVPVFGTYYLATEPGQANYATIVPQQLPIFSYMRLPALVINAALGALGAPFRVGTPWSDALTPAMKILVNIGYDDVITPDDLNTVDPNSATNQTYAQEGYQAYDRTFLKSGSGATVDGTTLPYTPFGSVDPLTPAERAAVAGDVFEALLAGFRAQFAKPLFGYIERVPTSAPAAGASRTAVPPEAMDQTVTAVSEVSVAPPRQVSVRPVQGKSDRAGSASVRKPAPASVGSGDNAGKPAAAQKRRATTR